MRCRNLAVLIAAFAMTLLAPSVAAAHTKLVEFAPSGSVETAPTAATITFSRDVSDLLEEVSLTAPSGDVTMPQRTIAGSKVTVPMPSTMAAGTWTVEWSVIGADGHPVRASRSFKVSHGTIEHAAMNGSRTAFPVDRWERVSLVGRIVFFTALLGFVGGAVFAMWPAQGFRPWRWGTMAIATSAGALAILTAHSAIVDRRSGGDFLSPGPWIDGATSVGARGYVVAAICVLVAWRLGASALLPAQWRQRGGALPWGLIALLAVAIAAPTFSSHAMDSGSILRAPLDILHLIAAAVWLGGLTQVVSLTRRARSDHAGVPLAVDRYSRLALGSVVVLVLTGAYAAWSEIGGFSSDLFTTTYGRLVLLKLVLLAVTLPLAWRNKEQNVPDLRIVGPSALPRLRKYVLGELAIVVWIVVATAFLVYETPPRHSVAEHNPNHPMEATP